VVVTTDDENVTGELLVDQLSKWSAASGKYVKIADK
jgi:hypothetical protein